MECSNNWRQEVDNVSTPHNTTRGWTKSRWFASECATLPPRVVHELLRFDEGKCTLFLVSLGLLQATLTRADPLKQNDRIRPIECVCRAGEVRTSCEIAASCVTSHIFDVCFADHVCAIRMVAYGPQSRRFDRHHPELCVLTSTKSL